MPSYRATLLSSEPHFVHRNNHIVGDVSDITKGFQLESFRMPSEDVNHRLPKVSLRASGDVHPDALLRPDEALVTMFISKEAAAQCAGADRHFPGHPSTARPRGATPRASTLALEPLGLLVPTPLSNFNFSEPPGGRLAKLDPKSPLLMAQLPPRKHDYSIPSSYRRDVAQGK